MSSCGERLLNFNVGVVGHIDSGKTSLSKVLSTTASTASFDKNPQSQERGITIDLGFSSFVVDAPDALRSVYDKVQFTLVDCPGHASLIRTIIGGAQIIDMMLLVVDVTKGVQTQTAECLVLGEITTPRMVVALNKVDLLPPEKRTTMVDKMTKRMQKTLEKTRFAQCLIVAVAARPGGIEAGSAADVPGLTKLISVLRDAVYLPDRNPSGPFLFAVDHCFSIKGQGTIMTGTVISGSVRLGDNVEVASVKEVRKVKSIQMFKKTVESASQGDRVGICIAQFDSKLVERGLVCSPSTCPALYAAIAIVRPIHYFKGNILTKSKFHVSIGHSTVMATCHFFDSLPTNEEQDQSKTFSWDDEYAHRDQLEVTPEEESSVDHFVLLEFEKPVLTSSGCLLIASRLDADIHQNSCRLAFQGRLLQGLMEKAYAQTVLPRLKIYKTKHKEGIVDRVTDAYTVIGRALFKKETNIEKFSGMKIRLSTGEAGVIEGSFGQSGKVKIRIPDGLKDATMANLTREKKRAKETVSDTSLLEPIRIALSFKRYVFDCKKRAIQT